MAEPAYQLCVAPRKDGRPCRGLGRVFDPERNGLVYDAHQPGGPGNVELKQARMEIAMENNAKADAEDARRREALTVGLSDDGLSLLLKDLQKFREGKPLSTNGHRLLVDLLTEDHLRQPRRKEWRNWMGLLRLFRPMWPE